MKKFKGISLFSSGGLGELALDACGIQVLLSNELISERHDVFQRNFEQTFCVTGDIWKEKDRIIEKTRSLLNGDGLDFIYATPPCQGMSKNGRGKLLNSIRKGAKPPIDERNLLIIPTLEIIKHLNPHTIIFENVPEMESTVIPTSDGKLTNIIDLIKCELGSEYVGRAEVVEFANYGVPQKRQRLISIFSRHALMREYFEIFSSFVPEPTHNQYGKNGLKKWVTVRDIISNFPPLDAKSDSEATHKQLELHKVPLLDEEKYFWVSNTPAEKSAFDNQCIKCDYGKTLSHGTERNSLGINRAKEDTPVRCNSCGSLLPRPWVVEDGIYRIMKGFTSAYKRMSWDSPSPALTRNLSYACSDNKLHPEQNRVLSLWEAIHLHTINYYSYKWERSSGKKCSDKLIREIIGESIPPKGFEYIIRNLVNILNQKPLSIGHKKEFQLSLFNA